MFHGDISQYVYHFSYLGIFLWFAVIEQFTPIPEDVSLITIGYISMHTPLDPWLASGVSLIGLLTADNVFSIFPKKDTNWQKNLLVM